MLQQQMPVSTQTQDEAHLVVQQVVKDFASVEAAVEGVYAVMTESVFEAAQCVKDHEVLSGRLGILHAEGFQDQRRGVAAGHGVGFHAPVAGMDLSGVAVADPGEVLEVSPPRFGQIAQVDGDDRVRAYQWRDRVEVELLHRMHPPGRRFQLSAETFGGIIQSGGFLMDLPGDFGHQQRAASQDSPEGLADEFAAGFIRALEDGLEKAVESCRKVFQ